MPLLEPYKPGSRPETKIPWARPGQRIRSHHLRRLQPLVESFCTLKRPAICIDVGAESILSI